MPGRNDDRAHRIRATPRPAERQPADRQNDRQADRQTDSQNDRQNDTQKLRCGRPRDASACN